MDIEIRPLRVGEANPLTSEGNVPELWRLHKVGLIQGSRRVACWKCGFPVIQSGLFLELEGRDGCHCRVVSWSNADGAGLGSVRGVIRPDVEWIISRPAWIACASRRSGKLTMGGNIRCSIVEHLIF